MAAAARGLRDEVEPDLPRPLQRAEPGAGAAREGLAAGPADRHDPRRLVYRQRVLPRRLSLRDHRLLLRLHRRARLRPGDLTERLVIRDRWQLQRDQRSEEHTTELQSLMRISYAVF